MRVRAKCSTNWRIFFCAAVWRLLLLLVRWKCRCVATENAKSTNNILIKPDIKLSREPSSWLLRPPNCEAERNRVREKERARENRCNKRHGSKQWNRYESAEIRKLHMVIYWKRSTRERMGSHIPDRKKHIAHSRRTCIYTYLYRTKRTHRESNLNKWTRLQLKMQTQMKKRTEKRRGREWERNKTCKRHSKYKIKYLWLLTNGRW